MYRKVVRLLTLPAVVLLMVSIAPAQENATVTGTVLDSTGAVVPNVQITLTNPATAQARTAISNADGLYLFANVGVGELNLGAAARGFQRYLKKNIVVNVAQSLKEDIILTVGSEAQEITVQANALQVQSETNELSNLISGQQVTQLATNGRNVTALAALGLAFPITCRPLAA